MNVPQPILAILSVFGLISLLSSMKRQPREDFSLYNESEVCGACKSYKPVLGTMIGFIVLSIVLGIMLYLKTK